MNGNVIVAPKVKDIIFVAKTNKKTTVKDKKNENAK